MLLRIYIEEEQWCSGNLFGWRHEGRGFDFRLAPLLSVLKQDSLLLVAQCFGGHFKLSVQSAKSLSSSCFL